MGLGVDRQARRQLVAPFPWFGSKRQVADLIWERFGEVANYVEPFAGSLAVLLANPLRPKIETVNDADAMIVNFWRAVSIAPDDVARHVDAPSSDLDLRARQTRLLLVLNESWKACVSTDPDFVDAKVAGWWLYGVCSSVGSNWLATKGANASIALSSAGVGVHRPEANAQEMMARLAARLRKVRVCCRDWSELLTPSVTFKNRGLGKSDVTGVLLDPPYVGGDEPIYREHAVAFEDVRRWAIENGDQPLLRIALCAPLEAGEPPVGWRSHVWTPNGGYSRKRGDQRRREQIWFSPSCLEG